MEPNAESFGAHSKIDSIVLNAPVADVYACCSRFEELLDSSRLCKMYRKSTKPISPSHLCWMAKNTEPFCRLCSVCRSGESHGKQ